MQEVKLIANASLPAGFLLFPEGDANARIMNGGFPAVRLGESPDEFLAALAHTFTGPDEFELLLERDTEFLRFESIPNVIGEGVQTTLSFIPPQTQYDI